MRIGKGTLSLAVGTWLAWGALAPAGTEAEPSQQPFAIAPGSFQFSPANDQAGAHVDWVTKFDFAHGADGKTFNDLKDTIVNLPAGFTASNTAVPTCPTVKLVGQFAGHSDCPPDTQIGTITLDISAVKSPTLDRFPVYNMEVTTPGVVAQLGFDAYLFEQLIDINVRPGDSGLTATAPDTEDAGEPHNITFTVWALPASPLHDAERGLACYETNPEGHVECSGGGQEVSIPVRPFLSNPTSCGAFTANMQADSWEQQGSFSEASSPVGPIAECERLPFSPSIEAQPSTRSAESPTGLELSLLVPQSWERPESVAVSNLKETVVTLPEGMTANPGLAEGLGACTAAQYAAETASSLPGEGCPPESKIGSIEIETPLLAETIPGAIYIAAPYANLPEFGDPEHPGGSLLALYIVAKDPARGILIKVAGKIEPNPVTGRLVSTFANQPAHDGGPDVEGLPQQPFSKFTLKFRPGATAPLISPPVCGSYAVSSALTPWSAPLEPRLASTRPFTISQGVDEGACPAGGVPPFQPEVISGTQNNAGGSYSSFYLRVTRHDGEQELVKFSTTTPPGLTGNLSGVAKCPDAAIEAAKVKSGAEEEASPSCPAASEIGHTLVGAGVGSVLAQNPGKVYLAGPYHGAPLSIVSITSAKVGPFDLGTVVIRFALDINPITGQVEISGTQSDPIPHIIKGIVVHVRDIRTYIDRPNFMINPTNCEKLGITDSVTGSGSNYANPANQDTVNVTTPFEAADCASLAFKPSFAVATSGKTSRKNGASLQVKLTYPNAALGTQANIRYVKVDLPRQLPSRLETIQKACPDHVFEANPALCPQASLVGTATTTTPIVPVPLTGPAYFVSHGARAFPDLIVVLQGYGITIDLRGETFIAKNGQTSTTFRTIPDEPVGTFEMTLPEGPFSALAAPTGVCKITKTVLVRKKRKIKGKTVTRKVRETVAAPLTMPTRMIAQNGAVFTQNTKINTVGCPKAKKKPSKHGKGKRKK